MAVGVAARRRAPLVAAALVFAALTVMEQLGDAVNTSLVGPFPSAFIVSYSIGANLEGRGLAVGVAWLGRARRPCSRPRPDVRARGSTSSGAGSSSSRAPVRAGRLLRDRARLARALRAAASEDDAEPWAEQAVAEERSRIAAELHDVVARALRRMVVDADGAGAARRRGAGAGGAAPSPPSSRPAATRWPRSGGCSACCAARTTSSRSPRSRRSPTSPTSSAARAPPACPWRCASRATAVPLPAGADLTAYRVVQEALAGAMREGGRRRGAGGRPLRRRRGRARGPRRRRRAAPAPMGIAERVALYGGELRTARRRDGRQTLRARLPLGSAA